MLPGFLFKRIKTRERKNDYLCMEFYTAEA